MKATIRILEWAWTYPETFGNNGPAQGSFVAYTCVFFFFLLQVLFHNIFLVVVIMFDGENSEIDLEALYQSKLSFFIKKIIN
jgi:hypothetical protein